MPEGRILDYNISDSEYIREFFPDVDRDYRYHSIFKNPALYFNMTYYGRSVIIRRTFRGYECAIRGWFSARYQLRVFKSKRNPWHVYYYSSSLSGAVSMFFKLCRELLLLDNLDFDTFDLSTHYVNYNLFGN